MKFVKVFLSFVLSVLLSQIPAAAASASEMIPTNAVVAEMSRTEMQNQVHSYLQEQQVRDQLQKNGVSAEEISSRLASLSERELKQLSGQIQEARAGGDILVTVLIVVLIIYLVKRI